MDERQAKEIGRRIAQARRETDEMTQNQLAELLDVSPRSVQDYERGLTVPWRHFQRLEQIFAGRSLRWFLHGEQEPALPAEPDLVARIHDELIIAEAKTRDDAMRRHDELVRRLDELSELIRVVSVRLDQVESRRER